MCIRDSLSGPPIAPLPRKPISALRAALRAVALRNAPAGAVAYSAAGSASVLSLLLPPPGRILRPSPASGRALRRRLLEPGKTHFKLIEHLGAHLDVVLPVELGTDVQRHQLRRLPGHAQFLIVRRRCCLLYTSGLSSLSSSSFSHSRISVWLGSFPSIITLDARTYRFTLRPPSIMMEMCIRDSAQGAQRGAEPILRVRPLHMRCVSLEMCIRDSSSCKQGGTHGISDAHHL